MVYLNIKSHVIKQGEIFIPVVRAIITISIKGFLSLTFVLSNSD